MNSFKKIIGAVLLSAIALVHFDGFAKVTTRAMQSDKEIRVATEKDVDAVIEAQTAQVQQMTADAEKVKMDAQAAIEAAQEQLEQGKISRAQAAAIVGEQKYAIKKADETLLQVTNEAAQKVAEAEGYLSRFVSGVKSWYYGPEEEREVARARIMQLEEDLEATQDEYSELIKNARGNRKKSSLKAELATEEEAFKNEIQKQKDIAEGRMSSQKFWRSVAKVGAVIGAGALLTGATVGAYRYFGGEALPVVVPTPPSTGTGTPPVGEEVKEVKYDTPPTLKDITESVKQTASNIYQTGQQGVTALGENIEDIRQRSPFSQEGQAAIGKGKYEEAQANFAAQQARQQAQTDQANEEYMRREQEIADREAARQQRIADLKAEDDARIAAREENARKLAEAKQQRADRNKTPGQLKKEAERAEERRKAGSGARGWADQRAQEAQRQKNSKELAATNKSIKALEEERLTKQEALTKQQAQLDTLKADLNKMEKKAPGRMKKEHEILQQSGRVSKATKARDDVDARLKFYSDKAAELQE